MEAHRCKLSYMKSKFTNGRRALGLHVTRHITNNNNNDLTIQLGRPSHDDVTESSSELSSSPSSSSSYFTSSSEDEDDDQDEEFEKGLILGSYELRENPKKSIKLSDVEFSSSVSVTLDQDEIDRDIISDDQNNESFIKINPTRKRSERQFGFVFRNKRKMIKITKKPSSMSPGNSSSVTSEEDVALCLMMLSRDKYHDGEIKKRKFTCLTCEKVFKSYQALGGHRASHKKLRLQPKPEPESKPGPTMKTKTKTHECPVCLRVFGSAQALGGHKRTHSSGGKSGALKSNAVEERPTRRVNSTFIDLNLPAPEDEDDHDEISRVSQSAVSDPHF